MRLAAVVLAPLLPLLLLLAPPAAAAGTGGVDISPYPGVVDGRQVTAFHAQVPSRGDSTVRYVLRNTTGHTATARLFGTAASRDAQGRFTIGPAGSSPYLGFADQQVSLAPHETRMATFTVHPGPHGRPQGKAYAAVVVEVRNGSVIAQAATVVYLERGRTIPLPLLVVLVATGLLAAAGVGVLVVSRRRR